MTTLDLLGTAIHKQMHDDMKEGYPLFSLLPKRIVEKLAPNFEKFKPSCDS